MQKFLLNHDRDVDAFTRQNVLSGARYMSFRIEGLGFDRFDFFGSVIAQEILTAFCDGFLSMDIESATERRRPALKWCFLVL